MLVILVNLNCEMMFSDCLVLYPEEYEKSVVEFLCKKAIYPPVNKSEK